MYAKPFIRVIFGGTLADGQEIWSCSFHIADFLGAGDQAWADTVFPARFQIAQDVANFVAAEETLVPSGVQMDYLTLSYVGTDGKVIGETSGQPVDVQGNAVGAYVPQAALVNTLMADKFKDPGKYNRFYLPVTNAGFQGSYQLPGGVQAAYAARTAEMIDEVNADLADITAGVGSRVAVVSNASSGSQLPVSAVKLGRVIDTQRRRRNALSEAYVTSDVTP